MKKSVMILLIFIIFFSITFPGTGNAITTGNSLRIIHVEKDVANVYSLPRLSSAKISQLKKGQEFPILSTSQYYYKVLLLNRQTG